MQIRCMEMVMHRILRASKIASILIVIAFAWLAFLFFYVALDEYPFFYIPSVICFGMIAFCARPIFFPNVDVFIDDKAVSVNGYSIALNCIDWFYSDNGCIIIQSREKIGSFVFRYEMRIVGKEIFLSKFLLGEMKDVLQALTDKGLKRKSFLWRRLGFHLAP